MELPRTTLGAVDEFHDQIVPQAIRQQYLDHVKMDEYMERNQVLWQRVLQVFVDQELPLEILQLLKMDILQTMHGVVQEFLDQIVPQVIHQRYRQQRVITL